MSSEPNSPMVPPLKYPERAAVVMGLFFAALIAFMEYAFPIAPPAALSPLLPKLLAAFALGLSLTELFSYQPLKGEENFRRLRLLDALYQGAWFGGFMAVLQGHTAEGALIAMTIGFIIYGGFRLIIRVDGRKDMVLAWDRDQPIAPDSFAKLHPVLLALPFVMFWLTKEPLWGTLMMALVLYATPPVFPRAHPPLPLWRMVRQVSFVASIAACAYLLAAG